MSHYRIDNVLINFKGKVTQNFKNTITQAISRLLINVMILCISIAVRIRGLIGFIRHLMAQKMKMKIEALASRLGVLGPRKTAKKRVRREGGRRGRVGRIVTLPLQLSLLRGHHHSTGIPKYDRNSTSTPASGHNREY